MRALVSPFITRRGRENFSRDRLALLRRARQSSVVLCQAHGLISRKRIACVASLLVRRADALIAFPHERAHHGRHVPNLPLNLTSLEVAARGVRSTIAIGDVVLRGELALRASVVHPFCRAKPDHPGQTRSTSDRTRSVRRCFEISFDALSGHQATAIWPMVLKPAYAPSPPFSRASWPGLPGAACSPGACAATWCPAAQRPSPGAAPPQGGPCCPLRWPSAP